MVGAKKLIKLYTNFCNFFLLILLLFMIKINDAQRPVALTLHKMFQTTQALQKSQTACFEEKPYNKALSNSNKMAGKQSFKLSEISEHKLSIAFMIQQFYKL